VASIITDADNPAEKNSVGFILPTTMISRFIDGILDFIGHVASWIWISLVGVILFQVILRYGFNQGSIMLEEIQWHMYSIGFMIALSYGIVHDRHVRIDIVYDRFPPLVKAWVDVIGIPFLLLPFLFFVFYSAFPFVTSSYESGEVSIAPDGLPYRFAIKAFIIVGFALMILAAFSRLTRVLAYVIGWRVPPTEPDAGQTEKTNDPMPHDHEGEFA